MAPSTALHDGVMQQVHSELVNERSGISVEEFAVA